MIAAFRRVISKLEQGKGRYNFMALMSFLTTSCGEGCSLVARDKGV
jgi:hypothetical protein